MYCLVFSGETGLSPDAHQYRYVRAVISPVLTMTDTTSGDDPVEAVLFDVDGTLCRYERDTPDLLPVAFERAGVEPFFTADDYFGRFDEFINESEDVRDLRERCFADIAREKGRDPELGRDVARAYAAERDHTRVRWLDGAREVLDRFEGEFRLAAVTNGGPEMQSLKLDALGVDCFETVVYAGYDTRAKPDPEPFEVVLDALETSPERAVYVGNSLAHDVAGAHNAGLRAAWLDDGTEPEPVPDYVLETPRELLGLPWAADL